MSDKPVPMEVEEVGTDEYMLDFQGMLDRLDSPSEVQGEGVGDYAGDDLVVRESDVMGREGGGPWALPSHAASDFPNGLKLIESPVIPGPEALRGRETPAAAHVISESSKTLNYLNVHNTKLKPYTVSPPPYPLFDSKAQVDLAVFVSSSTPHPPTNSLS